MSYSGPTPSGMDDKNQLHDAFRGTQLPPTVAAPAATPVAVTPQPTTGNSRPLTAILVVIAIALVVVGVLLGLQLLKSSTSESVPAAAPETVTKKVEVITEVVTETTVATQHQQPPEPAADVDEANLAAGTFRVFNSDATISIAPSGLYVDAVQGSDFSSSFSTSFTSNPWR